MGYQPAQRTPAYSGSDPLLVYDVEYPERLSRWKIFVKWLLVIPHFIVLWFLSVAAGFVLFVAFFAILFTKRFPRGLWDFMLMYTRWTANVMVYGWMLQRDEYPPFGDSAYPVTLELEYPPTLSRWLIFVKWLLAIPHYFVLTILGIAMYVVLFIAFFAILITGRFPRGMFDFVVGVTRWSQRVGVYTSLMTDRYPPFSMD